MKAVPRKRGKPGCCRGCDKPWGFDAQCRRCSACLNCCGTPEVHNSCGARAKRTSDDTKRRSEAAYEGYWRSVENGKQKRP